MLIPLHPTGNHPKTGGGPGGGSLLDAPEQPAGPGRAPVAFLEHALQLV